MGKICLCLFLVLGEFFFMQVTHAQGFEEQDHCDLLGPNAAVLKNLSSHKDCQGECVKMKNCKGYVFISNWNRCFLKSEVKRLTKVSMISGLPGEKAKLDHDHSGKDMRQEAAANARACDALCRKESACGAYTFIEGYQTCWLKKNPGSFRPKVFYCGRKS